MFQYTYIFTCTTKKKNIFAYVNAMHIYITVTYFACAFTAQATKFKSYGCKVFTALDASNKNTQSAKRISYKNAFSAKKIARNHCCSAVRITFWLGPLLPKTVFDRFTHKSKKNRSKQ